MATVDETAPPLTGYRVLDLAGTLRRKGRKAVPIEQLSR